MTSTALCVALACGLALVVAPASTASSVVSPVIELAPAVHYPAARAFSGMGAGAVSAAEVTGDGRLDLVVADCVGGGPVVLRGETGGFAAPATVRIGTDACTVATAELNGDGHTDVMTVSYLSTVLTVLLGRGDGTFTVAGRYPTGVWSQQVAVADVDRDGDQDVAVLTGVPGAVLIFLGDGTGGLTRGERIPVGVSSPAIASGDLNADGAPDLVVTEDGSREVRVLLGHGDGSFAGPVGYRAGSEAPRFVAIADVNHDGAADLATANGSANDVSVLLGHGDGTFAPEIRVGGSPPGPAPGLAHVAGVAVADLNGDGHPDLAWSSVEASMVTVAAGDGTGRFTVAGRHPVARVPEPLVAADFTGDGRPDLAVPGNVAALPGDTRTAVALLRNTTPWGSAGSRLRSGVVDGMPFTVLLPTDYDTSGRRYPVLYLIHPGNGLTSATGSEWLERTDLAAFTAGRDVIVVLPNQPELSFYVDARDGSCRGETQLIRGLIPHIDATFRTVPDGRHRAIAGIAPGGFSAMHLAARHPDQFASAGTFSGEPDVLLGTRRSSGPR